MNDRPQNVIIMPSQDKPKPLLAWWASGIITAVWTTAVWSAVFYANLGLHELHKLQELRMDAIEKQADWVYWRQNYLEGQYDAEDANERVAELEQELAAERAGRCAAAPGWWRP